VRGLEQHRGHEHRARALVDRGGQPRGERVRRVRGQAHHLEPRLPQPRELAAQRVELAVGADQARAGAKVERRQQPDDELVRVRAEGDLGARVAEQRPEAGAYLVGLGERAPPLLVDVARRVVEGLHLTVERDIRPRLV
jgi:hypothetical protein